MTHVPRGCLKMNKSCFYSPIISRWLSVFKDVIYSDEWSQGKTVRPIHYDWFIALHIVSIHIRNVDLACNGAVTALLFICVCGCKQTSSRYCVFFSTLCCLWVTPVTCIIASVSSCCYLLWIGLLNTYIHYHCFLWTMTLTDFATVLTLIYYINIIECIGKIFMELSPISHSQ